MARQERKSFILYHSYETQFGLLSLEQRGELITAIFEYDRAGIPPEGLSPVVAMAFSFIRDALDRDREEYEATCRRQSENGKKGDRPRKEPSPEQKTHRFSEKPKKAYNDNENENENENDNDNGNGEEKKKEKESAALEEGTLFCVIPPVPPAAPPSSVGPRLSESEKQTLLSMGIPREYIDKRLLRASSFAEIYRKSVYETLLDWWREDQRIKGKPKGDFRPSASAAKTYDLDDFWQAALARPLL